MLDPSLRSGEIPRKLGMTLARPRSLASLRMTNLVPDVVAEPLRPTLSDCHPEEERRGISVLDPSLRSGEIPRKLGMTLARPRSLASLRMT